MSADVVSDLLWVLTAIMVSGTDVDLCDEYSAHKNLDFIQIQSSPYISLTPVGRTFLTDDLEATSEWFKKLFVVNDTEANITYDPSCALTKSMTWVDGVEFTFVQYLDPQTSDYIQAAENQWKAVQDGQYDYSRWMDNHDGFQLGFDDIHQDFFYDSAFPIQKGGVFSRIQIPRTNWAMEAIGEVVIDVSQLIENATPDRTFDVAKADYLCRVPFDGDEDEENTQISDHFWWKSTFASADPEAAAAFVENYLFGTWITSEYPLGHNCTLSAWVLLPENPFQLHFALTTPCETPSPNIDEWVAQQDSVRSLESGKFDQHMSNNIVFWTESLDPFVEKLKADNVPFMVVELIQGLYGLYISIPKNAIVLQIRSDHLTVTKPIGTFDACADGSTGTVHD